jgi:nitrogenase molybdenum-iron protein NifN
VSPLVSGVASITDGSRAPKGTPVRSISTTNACRMCMPLGACLAFTGFEGTVPFLHGSQGCATYIRRYLISHFQEPMDIASSSVGEAATVFGGEANLREGIANISRVYEPQMVGVATTCLTETIGEDVAPMLLRIAHPTEGIEAETGIAPPTLVHAPTPSYAGTHADGYQVAVASTVARLAEAGETSDSVTLLPSIVSTADLRYLREIAAGFCLPVTVLPDYSDRLDGVAVARYERLPSGGATLADVAASGHAKASVTLGGLVSPGVKLAGEVLQKKFSVPSHVLPLPIGIRLTDAFTETLAALSGREAPEWLTKERGRLVDAYIDGHKHVAERTAVVFGDEDLVLGLCVWLAEIGITPAVCATGGRSGKFAGEIERLAPEITGKITMLDDSDFQMIGELAETIKPDILIGHSKGYPIARGLGVPLVRVGLPIHDRVGAQRTRHLGYRGAHDLFDRVTNALIEQKQDQSPVGYAYM